MRHQSNLRRVLLPIVAIWPLILMATSGGPGVAARDAGPFPALECPPCDDFNPCTVDSCDVASGTCRHDPLNCDDGNSCTMDSCSFDPAHPASGGGCVHETQPAGTACDDGLICTIGDICDDTGACIGQIQPEGAACDDGNSCTGPDACDDAGQCVAGDVSAPGSACDDGSFCTSDDTCVSTESGAVVCRGVMTSCDDGDPCTQDVCDPSTGVCGTTPINCDDGNACTIDHCDPATGACVRTNNPGPCSDGNLMYRGRCVQRRELPRQPQGLRRREFMHGGFLQPGDRLHVHSAPHRNVVRGRERLHDGRFLQRRDLHGRDAAGLRRHQRLHDRLLRPSDWMRPYEQQHSVR